MQGLEIGIPEKRHETEAAPEPLSPQQTASGRETPTTMEESFPDALAELEGRIDELKDHIHIKNTHKRIKFIVMRLVEIFPELWNIVRLNNTLPNIIQANIATRVQETIRRHETMMAELLRATDTREEGSPAAPLTKNDTTDIHNLTEDLMGHWEVVRAALGEVHLPPLCEDPLDTVDIPPFLWPFPVRRR